MGIDLFSCVWVMTGDLTTYPIIHPSFLSLLQLALIVRRPQPPIGANLFGYMVQRPFLLSIGAQAPRLVICVAFRGSI